MIACSVAYAAGCVTLVASPHALSAVHRHMPTPAVVVPQTPTPKLPLQSEATVTLSTQTMEENNTDQLPLSADLPVDGPTTRVTFGLPGFLTLALIKDTVLGLTGLRWQANRSDPELIPCGSDNPGFEGTPCSMCNRLHGNCANQHEHQGRRLFLDQISGRIVDQLGESSHRRSMEQSKDSFWDKASVFSEKVQNSFSDIVHGFQTTTYVPIVA